MNYGRYNRAVMVLSEQGREFAAKEGGVTGSLKVETGNNKGAMRCSVENVRAYLKGDYLYKLILFGSRGEKTIHAVIGNIPISRNGSGESYFRFDPLDVDGKGNGFECFTTAIVAAVSMKDSREPLHPVLKGETGNEPEEVRPRAANRNREETATEDRSRESMASERKGGEKEKRFFNRFYNECILNSCIHTCQVAEFYEEVKPFADDKTGARWKKILNIMNLPLVSPGAHYFASLYHHYLFGAKPDERGFASCYFFGIPGRSLEAEQPDGGRSGFVYWQPMKGTEEQKNPYGYWILEIDGQTGDIREVSIEMQKKV